MTRRKAVQKAIELYPGSLRKLAREAGYSHVTLSQVRAGNMPATDNLVAALLQAVRKAEKDMGEARRILKAV